RHKSPATLRVRILDVRGVAVAGAICAASALAGYAVRGRSSSLLAPSVWRGSRERRTLALTFDDGPSEGTGELLDLLDHHQIPATFFLVGRNVERLPDLAREMAAAGHEAGNHSHSHPYFCFRSAEFIAAELRSAQETIRDVTGQTASLFRAPYGVRWLGMREAQRRLNLKGVMWTVMGLDWKLPVDEIVTRVASRAANGGIICLHDGRELVERPDVSPTLEAVRRLIPLLRDRGFAFETVSQLLCPTN
ncbi:MAG: polysaccharide deacetylase family protein, partial [Longimicrobiales bacterium]